MTPEETRQKKNQLIADMTNVCRKLDAVRQEKHYHISKVVAHFIEKGKPLDDRLNSLNEALELLQKSCQYHRLRGFYGICPDCNYYVRNTREDGLEAHP